MDGRIDDKCLIVRNFPVSFSQNDIQEFMQMFDPADVNIFVSQHTAIAKFVDKNHARNILNLLHQEKLEENRLFVEYAPKNRSHLSRFYAQSNNSTEPSRIDGIHDKDTKIHINDTLKRLFATADNLDVNQPPPPYLRYEYPKVNRDIIDAISIALECVPKFYIQVLHLMNRMNLEPPFMPGDKHLVYESSSCTVTHTTTETQTDEIIWQNLLRNKRKFLESDESELESSNSSADEHTENGPKLIKLPPKNVLNNSNKHEILKQKQRKLLKMQRLQKTLDSMEKSTNAQPNMNDAFDLDENQLKSTSIKIVVPDQLDTTSAPTTSITPMQIDEPAPNLIDDDDSTEDRMPAGQQQQHHVWSDLELYENRIPSDQLKMHPMFQNYSTGEISNRLYIKNIAKEVTEVDLRAIYDRYLEHNCDGHGNIRSIEIRYMTTGRMKGQAFVTFDGPYLNCDVDDETAKNLTNKYKMIEKALHETNGLILKGKPIVVVFGKKK